MIDGITSYQFLRVGGTGGHRHFYRRSLNRIAAITIALTATSVSAHAIEVHYDCNHGTGLTARFSPPSAAAGYVVLTFDEAGQQIRLPQVMSADGGRYANGKAEFWIKGKGATLNRNGGSETCISR
jgi:membrane-bound inhibitor of C-type lysozyme